MLLSMLERSQILNLLPQEGKREVHRLLDDLTRELQFNKEEMEVTRYTEAGYPFQDSDGRVSLVPEGMSMWDSTKDVPKDVEIVPLLMEKIVKQLSILESQERLPRSMGALYDRLVLKKE